MSQYCLSTATVAVQPTKDGMKAAAVMLPAGSIVIASEQVELESAAIAKNTLIPVMWDGKTVEMFLIDLIERGVETSGASA